MSDGRVSRGLRAGFCAAAAIAVWFTMVDVMRGLPLSSPAYMSGLVFSFTTALPATARLLAFTVLLFLTYGVIGVVVADVLDRVHMQPRWYMGIVIGLLTCLLAYVGSLAIFDVNVLRALGLYATIAGNLVAGFALIGYLRVKRSKA